MKHWRLVLIVVLLAGLLVFVAGCGSEDEAEPAAEEVTQAEEVASQPTEASAPEPTEAEAAAEEPTAAPEPTDTPEPTEAPPTDTPTPEPTEEPAELDVSTLASSDSYTSYRSRVTITVAGIQDGEEIEQTLEFTLEETTDPRAQHIVMAGEGLGDLESAGLDSIEMYTVEDTMYMKMGEDWLSMPADEGGSFDDEMFTPETFTEDTCGWKMEADTEVLGYEVHHYSVDRAGLEACATADMLDELGDVEVFDGDMYITIEGKYLVQMDVHFEGSGTTFFMGTTDGEELDEGTVDVHIEYWDINEPFVIEVPEEALASSGAPADIPVPPDATGQSNMFGMFTFQSALTPEELSDWYKAEMPNYGWTEDSAEEFGGMYTLEFSQDSRKASFMITGDADSGLSQVLITVEE